MHAPGHLREAFIDWVEDRCASDYVIPAEYFYDGEGRPIRWLFGQLWRCSDIMPSHVCEELGMAYGSTYAAAVQTLAAETRAHHA